MYETHGKNASSYLRLAPWGPTAYYEDVDVPKRVYQEARVGDQICIELHSGFLNRVGTPLLPVRNNWLRLCRSSNNQRRRILATDLRGISPGKRSRVD